MQDYPAFQLYAFDFLDRGRGLAEPTGAQYRVGLEKIPGGKLLKMIPVSLQLL